MKAAGQWNSAWDPFFELDRQWTDEFMATGVAIYSSKTFTPKEVELLSIAFDASYTHMYAPGTRRHIRAALIRAKPWAVKLTWRSSRMTDSLSTNSPNTTQR